ncbi:MAG: thioredoxin domain-containing protein [Acidobacteria bacterium]|nr:thioredoxin domain-containing protein [Acidobacteriota bacterium]
MKTHARTLIIGLAALGLAASVASLYVHYQILADPSYVSFCDVSETVSCESVLTSQYGKVFGIPVAVGGALWSALVLMLGVMGMKPAGSEKAGRVAGYVFVLSTIGLAGVLYLGYASFFLLRQMCPLCLTMYVAVIGLFAASGAAASSLTTLAGRLGDDLKTAIANPMVATLGVLWVVAALGLVAFFPSETELASSTPVSVPPPPTEVLGADEVAQFTAWMDAQPRVELGVPSNGARVVVVKFNDYQCPACRQAHLAYRGIQQKYATAYPGQVAFVSLDYPLEAECNQGGIHASACEAAVAVRLARAKNRGPEMEEWLFANQDTLTRDRVKEGLNEVAQVTDFDDKYDATLVAVRTDAQLGQKLQISGTPTFFINGIRIGSTLRPAYFDAAIAHELEKSPAPKPQATGPQDAADLAARP